MKGLSAIKGSDWRLPRQGSYVGIIVHGFECHCGVIVLLSHVKSLMRRYRRSVLDSETLIARVIRTRLELTSCLFLMPAIVPFHRSSIWAVGCQVLYVSTLARIVSYFISPLFPSFCMFFVSPSCPRVRLLPSYLCFFVPPPPPVFCPSGFVF